MAKRKNKRSSEGLSTSEIIAITNAISKVIITLITISGYVAIAYFLKEAIEPLAGKLTIADFDVTTDMGTNGSIFCPTTFVLILAVIFGGIGIRTASRERALRHKNTEELSSRIQFLETQLDANRTSSELTTHGETREEDK